MRFYEPNGPFRFVTPDGWTSVPMSKLPSEQLEALEEVFGDTIIAVSKLTEADYFISPYIITQFETTGTTSESKIEKLMLTGEGRDKVLAELEEGTAILTWVGEGAELADAYIEYNEENHAIITTMELDYRGAGNILVISAELLGSYRKTTMHFYADGPDTKHLPDLVAEIVDSFEYEGGYGFGGGLGVPESTEEKMGLTAANMLIFGVTFPMVLMSVWWAVGFYESECRFPFLVLISAVGAGVCLIPWVGLFFSCLAMWGLLCKFSTVEDWPDAFVVSAIGVTAVKVTAYFLLMFVIGRAMSFTSFL